MPQFKNSAILTPTKTASSPVEHCWRHGHTPLTASDHFYLQVMGIDPRHLDLRIGDEDMLLVPMREADSSALAGVMLIAQDGTRTQLVAGSATNPCYSAIHGERHGRIFCADFATAWTLWQATGRSVVVCWGPERLKSVIDSCATQPGDCVAVDHLYPEPDGLDFSSRMRCENTTVNVAMETGLPFYVSKPGTSFHAMGVAQTREIFSRAPVSSVPMFDVDDLKCIKLADTPLSTLMKQLSATKQPVRAASLTYTVAARRLREVPVVTSLQQLRHELETAIKPLTIHPVTIDRIFQQLEKNLEIRRQSALAPASLPSAIAKSHDHEIYPAGLPAMKDGDWRGVIIVRGPTGSGKTQFVGGPFSRWAAAAGESFVAICHRISLTTELARRLDLTCYTDVTPETDRNHGLAICLPSITLPDFQTVIKKTRMVFIDEISQVLRFLEVENCCQTSVATNKQVYEELRSLVASATCVVVADASVDARTIQFLESCRPGEKFRVIDVPHPDNAGINAVYYHRQDAVAYVACEGQVELESGGRIWIAAEAKTSARELAQIFSAEGYRTLAIDADNKINEPQKRFLANADAESLQYDVVIASPVIGSGLSIQHEQIPEHQRFTLGLYIGGGFTTTPSDAIQQLRRVRYLRRFVIGLRPNCWNNGKNLSAAAQISAAETASRLEGRHTTPTSFDHFVAEIRAQNEQAKSDFAAGLLWQIDACGWNLRQSVHQPDPDKVLAYTKIQSQVQDRYVASLIQAPVLNQTDVEALRCLRHRTEAQNRILEANTLRSTLGIGDAPLTEDIIHFWDSGRGVEKLELFDSFRGIVPKHNRTDDSIISRNYPVARAKQLKSLFSGLDLEQELDKVSARQVVDRVQERQKLLHFLGIAPLMSEKGDELAEPVERNYPIRDVGDILRRMGLKLQRFGRRVKEPTSDGAQEKSTGTNPVEHYHRVVSKDFERMTFLADQRNLQRQTIKLDGLSCRNWYSE